MKSTNIAAIVLAAGMSSRMGALKPLLPLGENTIVEHVVCMFRSAGVDDVYVVTGNRAEEISAALASLNVQPVVNDSWESGMLSSVKSGVENLPADCDAFFLLPTDIPLVRAETVRSLLAVYQPGCIIHPTFQGYRGHPPLISSAFRQEILDFDGSGGLHTVMKRNESSAFDVAVADRGILSDMDTPQDYHRIVASYQRRQIPTVDECRALMKDILHVEPRIVEHCRAVADVAFFLGNEVNKAGGSLDLDLIMASGLLHDMARGQADHAGVAAKKLVELGYQKVARIVAVHMDISIGDREAICEDEIVCLADKLTSGSRIVPLKSRFAAKNKQYMTNPDALLNIKRRLEVAKQISSRLKQRLGRSFESINEELIAKQTDDLST